MRRGGAPTVPWRYRGRSTWVDGRVLAINALEASVLGQWGRAPRRPRELGLRPRLARDRLPVAIVRVGDAARVGRAGLDLVPLRGVRLGGTVRAVVVPHDQVDPVALADVVCPVPPPAEVRDCLAASVLVLPADLPVVCHGRGLGSSAPRVQQA